MSSVRRFQFHVQATELADFDSCFGTRDGRENHLQQIASPGNSASMSFSKTPIQPDDRIAIDSTKHPEDSRRVRLSAEDTNVGKGLGTLRVRKQMIEQIKDPIKDR